MTFQVLIHTIILWLNCFWRLNGVINPNIKGKNKKNFTIL